MKCVLADLLIQLSVLAMQETMEIVYKGNSYHLDDILLDKFCPSDLIEPGTAPLLLEPQRNTVCLAEDFSATAASSMVTQVLPQPSSRIPYSIIFARCIWPLHVAAAAVPYQGHVVGQAV